MITRYFKFDGTNIRMRLLPRLLPWFFRKQFTVDQFRRWLELRTGFIKTSFSQSNVTLECGVNIDDRVARHITNGVIEQDGEMYCASVTIGAIGNEKEYLSQEGKLPSA
jgi:hypothetical protein